MNTTKKISFLFVLTGLLIIAYSFVVINYFDNADLGKNFHTSEFHESDIYKWLGMIWIVLGLIYFLFYWLDKIQLEDRLTNRHYWHTLFFVILMVSVPILDKYYPTNKYRGTFLMNLLDAYIFVSIIMFVVGTYAFLSNIIKSTYAYFVIKRGWKG